MEKEISILIIEDEKSIRDLLSRILSLEGYKPTTFDSAEAAMESLEEKFYYVALIDVFLPGKKGTELIDEIKERSPGTEIIIMTAYANIRDGIEAIKKGAYDYIEKGKDEEEIILKVKQAADKSVIRNKLKQLENKLEKNFSFASITGKSRAISESIELAKKVADTDTTVLLLGETGTGKELFAQAIHNASERKNLPFVAVNCTAIPKDLQESEFFGYVKGAFTGAVKDKQGYFVQADKGTIFLDEIGDMNSETQAKLLRVLETNSFIKVGDSKPTRVNIRLISATNKDLRSEIDKGHFREDLFYRLNTFAIYLPPLRERKDDLELLIDYYINQYRDKLQKKDMKPAEDFISSLKAYSFPGNIRELKNIIERAAIICSDDELTIKDLPDEIFENPNGPVDAESLKEIEKQHILKIYSQNSFNKTLTAEKLGIGSVTLYRKLKEYGAY